MNNALPDPDLLGELFWGVFKPQLLRLALQLDLFTPLAAGPATAASVAQARHCAVEGMRALLDYFTSLRLLEKQGDQYSLTPTAATFLVPGCQAYAGDMILDYTGQAMYDSIFESLCSGKPRWLNENFVQDAWLESYTTWRIPSSLEMWQAAGVNPGARQDFRLLDIACGCAIKSLSLAQASPAVQVTCLDSPEVLQVARDLTERMQVGAQVQYLPLDLLQADLGQGEFDAALLGQITHYLTVAQNRDLFHRIHRALVKDGILVIDCPMRTAEPTEQASFLTLFLWANNGGAAHSFEDYWDWLQAAGFRAVRRLGERWLSAEK